jgi:AcrR family transcriptional regulator
MKHMKPKGMLSGKERLGRSTATAADWAEAALQLISESGLDALTVDALSRRLGVTKGSFYWHFTSREDLLQAALERWQKQSIEVTLLALRAVDNPFRRLELLLDAAAQPPRSLSLYAALAGAPNHSVVRRVLKRVASERIAYLTECYLQLGLPEAMAKAHSVLANAAYRGLLQLANEAPESMNDVNWQAYARTFKMGLTPGRSLSKNRSRAVLESSRKRTPKS